MKWKVRGAEETAPPAAPLRGYPADSSTRDIATARRMIAADELIRRRCGTVFGFAKAVAAEQQNLGVFHEPIHDGGGDGGVEENVAQSENAVFVVIRIDRFWLWRVEMT